jgi:hypothetical protein
MIARRLLTQSGAVVAGSLLLGCYRHPLFAQPPGQVGNQRVLHVGPTRAIKTIADVARLAMAGRTIEVDSGDDAADVAVWEHDGVTVRAVSGQVRLAGAARGGRGQGHLGGARQRHARAGL